MTRFRQIARNVVAETLLAVFCIIPGLIFSYKLPAEPWLMFRIARASLSLQADHVVKYVTSAAGYRAEHIGGEMVHAALIAATKWPLEWLALLPLGSLLFVFLYLGLSRELCQSRWSAVFITIYASWSYVLINSQFGTQTYTWTHVLFLGFLLLLLYWLRARTATLSVLMMLFFLSTFLHYHTTPIWIAAATTASVAIVKLMGRSKNTATASPARVSWALPLFCVVLYLAFDTVIYGNGLARVRSEVFGESLLRSVMTRIIAPLVARSPAILHPFEVAPLSPRTATWTTLAIWVLLTFPIGFWVLSRIYRAIRLRSVKSAVRGPEDIFVLSIVFAAVAHALIYGMYGAVSLRVIPLAFALALPIVGRDFRLSRQLELGMTAALAILSVIGFTSYAGALTPNFTSRQTGLVSKLLGAETTILSSANVYGAVLLSSVRDHKIIDYRWLDSDLYARLVGQSSVNKADFAYAVVDTSGQKMTSTAWVNFEPWTEHLTEINRNDALNKVYDSGNFMIYQPDNTPLSGFMLAPADAMWPSRSLLGDSFRLFLAIVGLFFVPGAIFLFIMNSDNPLRIYSPRAAICLVVGVGITFVTLVGYLTNFTSLGLKWFVPLCGALPWLALGVTWIVRRRRLRCLRLDPSWVSYGLTIVVVLVTWSVLSVLVADARTQLGALLGAQQGAQFTEFFVTRERTDSRELTINVVNRQASTENYTIVLKLDDRDLETLGSRFLPQDSVWIEEWQPPLTSEGGRLSIVLERGGVPFRELHVSMGNGGVLDAASAVADQP